MDYKDIKEDIEVMVIQPNKTKETDGTVADKTSMWKGRIISMVEGSKTKVIVKDIERGDGWNEASQEHKGVKKKNGWKLGKNNDYGVELEVHRKYLNEIKEVITESTEE